MRKFNLFSLVAMVMISSMALQSCKNDDNDDDDMNPEFVADDNTFNNFMSWVKEAEFQGADPALGMAHGGNDSTVTREIFFKNGQNPSNGVYAVGTLIAKHSHNPGGTVNEFTAMAKRGNNFNSGGGDWEWFMLNPDGTIATDESGMKMRGANLMGGMCLDCHAKASTDYVFSK